MQRVLVSFLFFVGLMILLRCLLTAIPAWKAARRRKLAGRNEDKNTG